MNRRLQGDDASDRARVLVLDEEAPWPPNTGKRIRTLSLLKRLTKKFDIELLVHGPSSEAVEALRGEGIVVHVANSSIPSKKGLSFYLRLLRSVFSRYPYSVSSHYQAGYAERLDELLREGSFDLIHCEWTPYARYIRPGMKIPWVVSAHNVESQIWERMAAHAHPPKSWFIGLQARRMLRFEKAVFESCRTVIAVSAPDGQIIRSLSGRDAVVVPNGVDTAAIQAKVGGRSENSLLFTGSLDWRPNQDAVVWFLEDILPLLDGGDSLSVQIVGRNPPQWLRVRCEQASGVSLFASVPDMEPYLRGATLSIVPLRIGGGSRLKILESFAAGAPVVSTAIGAEGLDVEDDVHCLIADSPEDFARSIGDLLRDPARREALSRAGRLLVEERYDWGRLAVLQEEAWSAARVTPA
jgi:glycosyltransferase involved in cell wall biosynthesis